MVSKAQQYLLGFFDPVLPVADKYLARSERNRAVLSYDTITSAPEFELGAWMVCVLIRTGCMHIAVLTLTFSLPGCASLKEKRQRIGGMHERFGRNPSVAVCESGEHDRHDASEWSFVVTARTKREVESLCSQIEDKIQRTVEGRVMNVVQEFL